MNKLQLLLPFGLFAILGTGLATHLLLPDREVSELENRTLAAAPVTPTAEEILSGDWSKQAESYFSDQFPARDTWLKTFVQTELAIGKTYINEKYYADFETGWITSAPALPQPDDTLNQAARNVAEIGLESERLGIPFVFYSLPAKATYIRIPHPEFMPVDTGLDNNERFLTKLEKQNINGIRLMGKMKAVNPSLEHHALFFQTDHHWNIDGAFLGYQALVQDLADQVLSGIGQPLSKEEMTRTCLPNPFEGSWNKFFQMLVPNHDEICYLEPDGFTDRFAIRATSINGVTDATYEDIYGAARGLSPDQPANYSIGYTTDYPELDIRNKEAASGHLVILKDSYFNPITFMVAYHFSRTTVIDMRYYEGNLADWLAKERPDAVIMAYNDRNFDLGL